MQTPLTDPRDAPVETAPDIVIPGIPEETLRLVREIVERERLTPADMIRLSAGDSVAQKVFGACTKAKCSGPHVRPTYSTKSYYCSCLAALAMRYDMAAEANATACSGVATPSPNTALQASHEPSSSSREITSASTVDLASGAGDPSGHRLSIASRCLENSSPQSLLGRIADSQEAPRGADCDGSGGAA